MNFDTSFFWRYLFDPLFINGAKVTLELALLAQTLGIIFGLAAALGRLSTPRFPIFRWLSGLYIWLFRGTPLLVQIVFVYFAIPQISGQRLIINEFGSALIALSINEGAYMAEIIRAGITSVDPGQTEAAQSLGMTGWLTMRRIVLPQAIRFIIPPTGNEFISMLKNTSLAYVVSTKEIFFQTTQLESATFRYFEPLTIVSLYYLSMTTVATIIQSFLERRYERGFVRDIRRPGMMQRAMLGALRRG